MEVVAAAAVAAISVLFSVFINVNGNGNIIGTVYSEITFLGFGVNLSDFHELTVARNKCMDFVKIRRKIND